MSEQPQEYVASEVAVAVSSSSSVDLDLVRLLGRYANIGWITIDSGTAYLQINDVARQKIALNSGDTFNFSEEEKWMLKRIVITATSATVRYFFKRSVLLTLART
jgi:hypothetical protein